MEKVIPLVSVCMPTYNGEAFLAEALDSVLAQSYPNLEIIISDDASTDATVHIAQKFQKRSSFPVHILHHKPSGIGSNWNSCMEQAKGKYIKFLFQDDVIEPECISIMVKCMEKDPTLGLVACKRNVLLPSEPSDRQKQWLITYGDLQRDLDQEKGETFRLTKQVFGWPHFFDPPLNNKIGEPSVVLFPKSILQQVGHFNIQLKQALDYEFWYRILFIKDILIINTCLAGFRLHMDQATEVNSRSQVNERDLWERILYSTYYSALHPTLQRRLTYKYAWHKRLWRNLKQSFLKSKTN